MIIDSNQICWKDVKMGDVINVTTASALSCMTANRKVAHSEPADTWLVISNKNCSLKPWGKYLAPGPGSLITYMSSSGTINSVKAVALDVLSEPIVNAYGFLRDEYLQVIDVVRADDD